MILLIETATQVCSVALSHEGRPLAEIHSDEPNAHSVRLASLVEQLMAQCHVAFADLDAVCVSCGPGSYTGLRIGVSAAKGYCYALQIPLLSVPTLQSMAAQCFAQLPSYRGLVCPMIDARRMECYVALYARRDDGSVDELRPVQADIVQQGLYDSFLDKGEVLFIGDGAEKTRPILSSHPMARYQDGLADAQGRPFRFQISAAGMASIAQQKLITGDTEDVAYFEPFYLKDFVAKKSVVRGLR